MLQIIRAIMKDKNDPTICHLLFANQVIFMFIPSVIQLAELHSADQVLGETAWYRSINPEMKSELKRSELPV